MKTIREQVEELMQENFVYKPNNYNFMILVNYILHKHGQHLLLPNVNYLNRSKDMDAGELFLHWYCDKETSLRKVEVPEFYKSLVNKGLKNDEVRFIVMPLVLHHKDCKAVKTRYQESMSHMTIVLYDKKYKYLEIFDSAVNTDNYDATLLPTILMNVLEIKLDLHIKSVIEPSKICYRGGIQKLQESEVYKNNLDIVLGGNIGFCAMYTLYYLDNRLTNINMKPWEVNEKMINSKSDKALTVRIVGYVKALLKVKEEIESEMNEMQTSDPHALVNFLIKLHKYFNRRRV